MTAIREAFAISGVPMGINGEEGQYYQVGAPYRRPVGIQWKDVGTVTRITVTTDLPGLHCDMERVRVYDGDAVIFEAPLHNLEGVTYSAPAPKP